MEKGIIKKNEINHSAQLSVISHEGYSAFAVDQGAPLGYFIETTDPKIGEEVLKSQRMKSETALKPIFLAQSLGDALDSISDGVVPDINSALESTIAINKRISELDPKIVDEGLEFLLLSFLYSRPGRSLRPIKHWTKENFYTFPLVHALSDSFDEKDIILESLVSRLLLQKAELVDRLRLCSKCEGAHLSYTDICPNCRSLDIYRKPFLHCFTCGHVAPEENFLIRDSLICPNCTSRLRHIGTDYDRPLENWLCNNCHHMFTDPKIIAKCMHCENQSDPENLIVKNIHTLEITNKGRLAAKSGSMEDIYSLLDNLNYVTPVYFESIIDWLLALCRRHSDERFGLIGIRLKNILELNETLGRTKLAELMDEFAGRIRSVIRTTDITTRTGRQNFWIFLAKSDLTGCRIVEKRILDLISHEKSEDTSALDFNMVCFSAPELMVKDEKAKLLIARLSGGIDSDSKEDKAPSRPPIRVTPELSNTQIEPVPG